MLDGSRAATIADAESLGALTTRPPLRRFHNILSPAAGSRLALFYAATFAVSGVHQPFWPVWLQAHGQDPDAIVFLLSIGVFVRILSNPTVAHAADRRGERRRLMLWLACASLAAFALFPLSSNFIVLLVLSLLFGCFWAPIGPLGDNLALLTVYAERLDYGRIRRWGSISYMLCSALAGWIITRAGSASIWLIVLACLLLTIGACAALPDRRVEKAEHAAAAPTRRLLRSPLCLLFFAGASLLQAAHAVYYSFFALHLRRLGYDETVSGLLWAEAVIVEILLFSSGALVRQIAPTMLLLVGAAAGLLRWSLMAETTSLVLLGLLQLLHALTFGASHLGAMHFLARAIPAPLSASAQSLYSAATGVVLALALLLAGPLYGLYGAGAYYAMTAMSLLGGACCIALASRWDGQKIVL